MGTLYDSLIDQMVEYLSYTYISLLSTQRESWHYQERLLSHLKVFREKHIGCTFDFINDLYDKYAGHARRTYLITFRKCDNLSQLWYTAAISIDNQYMIIPEILRVSKIPEASILRMRSRKESFTYILSYLKEAYMELAGIYEYIPKVKPISYEMYMVDILNTGKPFVYDIPAKESV
jgi:hypothetical protein